MSEKQRLNIRALEPGDADFMYEVENDSSAWRYSDTVAPLSRRILRDYALNYDADPFSAGQIRLIVTEEGNNTPVGIVDLYELSQRHLRAFVGIYICSDYRRHGYAAEAISMMEKYAFHTLHLHQLGAKIEETNTHAIRLFESLGYECRGRLKEWLSAPDGCYSDMLIYTKSL